jgi:hypothetical protein
LPIAQGALYGMCIAFVQEELRGIVARTKRAHRAALLAWLVVGAPTAVLLVAPNLGDIGLACAGPAWAAYALLVAVGGMLGKMRWGRLAAVFPRIFRGAVFILWFGLAQSKASFAACVVLCLMAFWIVQDLPRSGQGVSG